MRSELIKFLRLRRNILSARIEFYIREGINMSKLFVMDHPLIQHKLSMIRDKRTSAKDFRELINEVSLLMAYEVTRDLPLEEVEIETPIQKCTCRVISGRMIAVVPVLRAGLGMVDGIMELMPAAKVGHYRGIS